MKKMKMKNFNIRKFKLGKSNMPLMKASDAKARSIKSSASSYSKKLRKTEENFVKKTGF